MSAPNGWEPAVLPASCFRGWRWVLAAWVTAAFLLAHGCHGDEDTELVADRPIREIQRDLP